MDFAISPLGNPRVIYLGYQDGESPTELAPAAILVRPNEIRAASFYSGKFRENLGILSLAKHLEENEIRFGVVEASLFQCDAETTAELAVGSRAPLIGIAAYSTWMLDNCLHVARLIHELSPETTIVVGGHGAHFVYREILEQNPAVDVVVRSEGEEALLGLVKARSKSDWIDIPNLAYRDGETIQVNAIAAIDRDYDKAPLPHRFGRDLMETDRMLSQTPLMVVSSKGCFDRCTFCTVTSFYSAGWRGRSPGHVADEIEDLLSRYQARNVHFWDDTFTGPGRMGKRRCVEIAEEILRRDLKFFFHITARPSDLTEEVVSALSAAGLRSIFIGVESSVQGVLTNFFDKHATVDDTHRAFELLWKYDVHRILIGFILFHPQMTWRTFHSDLDLLDSLPTVEISRILSRVILNPGSELWNQAGPDLGPDTYKLSYLPPLADDNLERMYRVCANFYRQTTEIETFFVCLEERDPGNLELIDYLAGCRIGLFRFLSARVRIVAELLEDGQDVKDISRQLGSEIYLESLRYLDEMRSRCADEYFEQLIMANRLVGYQKYLQNPGLTMAPARSIPVSISEAMPPH